MKEYIAEYIVPVEKKGNDCGFDFMNAKPLIRCKDCKNWRPTGEWIGKCVVISNGTCCCCEMSADFFCAMAERKETE